MADGAPPGQAVGLARRVSSDFDATRASIPTVMQATIKIKALVLFMGTVPLQITPFSREHWLRQMVYAVTSIGLIQTQSQ